VRPAARDQALDAIRDFHAEHGRLPQWEEWDRATPGRPCARTFQRRWGWQELCVEAIGDDAAGLDVWEDRIDGRVCRMLGGTDRDEGRAGMIAHRRGVGAERAEAVGPDVREVLRELGACRGAEALDRGSA
jgi:hypothetical protein